MIAYFDTLVFDQIYGKVGCTGADIANLRKTIYGRGLSIRLSLHTLAEILLARRARPQALAAQIKLTLSLANFRTLIKPADQLLTDDLRAYAARGEADRPFLRGELQNTAAEGIAALIETDGEDFDEDFVSALEEARRRKERFDAILAGTRAIVESDGAAGSFERDWQQNAMRVAERLADAADALDACRQRGIEGALQIRSVRMAVALALGNASAANANPQSAALASHHAVSAAAVADTFVSGDAHLRELLMRTPLDGFGVRSLPDFLAQLAAAHSDE
jgi:hypothetical protein